jgi:hypothetical protein
MPKHAPSFKHLIATSSASKREQPRAERSVNDLLAALRVRDLAAQEREREAGGRDRDRAPHLASASSYSATASGSTRMTSATSAGVGVGSVEDVERAWTVLPGQERTVGLELDDGAVHPYVDGTFSVEEHTEL